MNRLQVLMCYGQYTNLDLAMLYGFVLPGAAPCPLNAHDTVRMPSGLLSRAVRAYPEYNFSF